MPDLLFALQWLAGALWGSLTVPDSWALLALSLVSAVVAKAAKAAAQTKGPAPTPFQQQVLLVPESCNVFLGGGRGGGKSYALALLAMRYCAEYGAKAKVLYLRQSYPGVLDWETLTRVLFGEIYGGAARYHAGARLWKMPGGGTIEIGQLEGLDDFKKYQGREWGLVLVEEAGQWPNLEVLDLLRSCLRGDAETPKRLIYSANPGGVGHANLARRFVLGRTPWEPFVEDVSGLLWVYAPSTLADNPHLDQEAYRRELEAATATDPELQRAWLFGDWSVRKGAYFSSVISESRCALPASAYHPESEWFIQIRRTWARGHRTVGNLGTMEYAPRPKLGLSLAYDHGSAAPAVCYIVGEAFESFTGPDGKFFLRGSILLLDELATNEPDSLTRGLGWTVPVLAEAITEMASRWGMSRPEGPADDSIFAKTGSGEVSMAAEFKAAGVYFVPAHKGSRVAGWSKMRTLLAAAGSPDAPGLYVSTACQYWWQTVPSLPRCPRRPDDVDSRGPDHGADACRMALTRREHGVGFGSFKL